MDGKRTLILTGWGHTEYVASAAVALKALNGRSDVCGVSRRRLPELLSELASERGTPRWSRIYLLGVSLGGDPDVLAGGDLEAKSGRVPDRLEDVIRLHVRRVYEKYSENLTRAAEALDVSRNTVRKYL